MGMRPCREQDLLFAIDGWNFKPVRFLLLFLGGPMHDQLFMHVQLSICTASWQIRSGQVEITGLDCFLVRLPCPKHSKAICWLIETCYINIVFGVKERIFASDPQLVESKILIVHIHTLELV